MTTTDRAVAATDAVSTGPDRSHRRRPLFRRWREELDARIVRCEWHGPQWEKCRHCLADA